MNNDQTTRALPPAIGRYAVKGILGRGGMGVVYRAHDSALDRDVALKVMNVAAGLDPSEVKRFEREARACAALHHQNIVPVYDCGVADGVPFLVMELIEGESLRAQVRRDGPLPSSTAARMTELVARALHYAHERKILHRDVKPANILLNSAGEPLLTDFGLARSLASTAGEGLTVTGQVVGTPAYMPPEQANGDLERMDRRADVYALGATLYQLLTGKPPFGGTNVVNILAAVMEKDPTPPRQLRPGLEADLETICLKCLEKDPNDRYANAEALSRDLGHFLSMRPIEAQPATALDRLNKWRRRNPLVARLVGYSTGVSLAALAALPNWAADQLDASLRFAEETALRASLEPSRSRALGHCFAERWPEAASELTRLLEANRQLGFQQRAQLHARRAKVHLELRSYELALEDCEAALALVPQSARNLSLRGTIRTHQERHADALEDFEGASTLDPTNPLHLANLGNVLIYLHRWREARETFDRVLDLDPTFVSAFSGRAKARVELGDLRGCIADCTRALSLDPELAIAYYQRGVGHAKLMDRQAALADFERSLRLSPTWAAHFARGVTRHTMNDLEGAEADFSEAIRLSPEDPRIYTQRGHVLEKLGAPDRAHADYAHALSLVPNFPDALGKRAGLRLRQGDRRGAIDDATRAIVLNPNQPDVLYWRAIALSQLQDLPPAASDLKRALELMVPADARRPRFEAALAEVEQAMRARGIR